MAKFIRIAGNSKNRKRAVSLLLAVTVLVSSVIFFGDRNMDGVAAEEYSRAYIEYIIDRMVEGLQKEFTILEIVPYEGQGMIRYYLSDPEIEEALEADQAKLEYLYNNYRGGRIDYGTDDGMGEWCSINGDFSRFGYGMRKNSSTNLYEVRGPELFFENVVPEYQDILRDRVNLKTVEANDLTKEDIESADLIFVSCYANERDNAVKFYKEYTGITEEPFYSKDGGTGASKSYDSFEKVNNDGEVSYISRDASWEMCQALLDYTINGRNLELPDGTIKNVKTPVVMEREIQNLSKDTNIYKFALTYGMNLSDKYNVFKEYISTSYVNEAGETVNYVNSNGLVTAAIDTTAEKKFDNNSPMSWSQGDGEDNPIVKLFNKLGMPLDYKRGNDSTNNPKPLSQDFLKDDFCIISFNSAFLYQEQGHQFGTSNGFGERAGNPATANTILQYLLGNKSGQTKKFSYTMRVLEIEPCNSFEYDTFEKVKKLGEKLLMSGTDSWTKNNYKNYIDVTCVTTNALNGMTVDLVSEYDMIIIGDNVGILTQDANGNTIYNDRNLNGYIYLAFGDLMKSGTAYLGFLPDDYRELYASNTSGLVKLNEQNKYLWPDSVYDSLIAAGGENKMFILKNMYEYYVLEATRYKDVYNSSTGELFLDYSLGNIRLADNDITDKTKEKLIKFAQAGKPVVLDDCLYDADGSKIYPTSDMYDYVKTLSAKDETGNRIYGNVLRQKRVGGAILYRNGNAPKINMIEKPVEPTYENGIISSFGERKLTFKFDITGQAGKTYKIKLYIDRNNDGVFKEIKAGEPEDRNELYFVQNLTLSENTMRYTVRSGLSENYVGMLSWKLEVVQLDDAGNETACSTSEVGYSAIKNEEPEDIYVLQILPKEKVTLDMSYNDPNKSNDFQDLLKAIESQVGYNIHIETIKAADFAAKYKPSGVVDNSYTKGTDYGTEKDKLKSYDMVVIGFADMYGQDDIDNTNGALDNILDFIDAGKSVLFTHDTLSWRSSPNYASTDVNGTKRISIGESGETDVNGAWKGNNWVNFAFNLTNALRSRVGMDKYGVTLSKDERDGKEVPVYDSSVGMPNYVSASEDGKYYVNELQGINTWTVYRGSFLRSYESDYVNNGKNLYALKPFNASNISYTTMWTTTKVEQLNNGSVTMYPYAIDKNLTVAETHGQYFELDMEDEDIVVWYTLADNGTSAAKYYSCTAKDAGNNYYIYSKNNITYSGAGHSNMNSEMELRLFVNTIVKAISGGNNVPVVKITNGSVGEGGIYYAYTNSTGGAAGYELDIKATDADLITLEAANGNTNLVGTFKKGEVYWIKPDGTEKLIKNFDSSDPLRNGIIRALTLGETSLDDTELETIHSLVEQNIPAKFRIYVEDSMGAFDQITVYMVERNLFNLN